MHHLQSPGRRRVSSRRAASSSNMPSPSLPSPSRCVIRVALASVLAGEASYLFFFPAVLIASAFGGWGPGCFCDFSRPVAGSVFRCRLSHVVERGRCERNCVRPRRRRGVMARRIIPPLPSRGRGKRRRCACARSASEIHSRHHPRCHDRHRRTRHHAILQRGSGTSVRLQRRAKLWEGMSKF